MDTIIENFESEPSSHETGDVAISGENGNSQLVSMQLVQDVYNEITGKTEEITKGYKPDYIIKIEDISQLNTKITQLYEQYYIQSSNCSVTIYYEEDQKQVYTSFERFMLYDSSQLSPTESILLTYEFMIVLPKTKRVQTYSLSVRIG